MPASATSSKTRIDSPTLSDQDLVLPSLPELMDKGALENGDMAKLTLRSLDCMSTFYHQQLLWSYETRLELEGELPEEESAWAEDAEEQDEHVGARRRDRDDTRSRMHAMLSQQNVRRLRQRRAFKMKLECIISPHSAAETALARQTRRRQCKRSREYANMLRTLELLAEMRMDSTQRLQYLVRRVNGADLGPLRRS
ncbi:hypothetical protein BD626DRAFT_400459 [Schizophyllum amplum]|uniref:Uncharacterized protein n=1 Tax=Schizophyllum amplum TaxID=97359 RepID=A0A550CIS6_9AGAR|nr:hypothetical protein BD626DRAFT_400459 [Auriculariopsis ampla]